MSKEKIIRLACIVLVGTVLPLALILAIAVASGMLMPPTGEEGMNPHYRPFFPDGSVELEEVVGTLDGEISGEGPGGSSGDVTGDEFGDGTLPIEPGGDMTLPDWESGMEWPTLPHGDGTLPEGEWEPLPEEWDTLPEEWETFPEDWGDIPYDPDDLADLLAGMNGSLGLPPGALAAGAAAKLTVMEVYAKRNDHVYFKMQSFGEYTGQEWQEAQAYGYAINDYGYSANYLPYYLAYETEGYPLYITPKMDLRVIPYYVSVDGDLSQIQTSDVKAVGAYGTDYILFYNPYEDRGTVAVTQELAEYENAYAAFVRQSYLDIDDTTLAYMRLIIEEQGFDPNDPAIVEKVAAYIQNAATYNLKYDQNLDSEPNVALAFLGAYKEGVCRHYATAATLLYRALGIPARYTVGFAADVKDGETTAVKGSEAHAWVEVYEYGFGWRCVEVTGSVPSDRPGDGTETGVGTRPDESGTLPPEPETETAPSYSYGELMAGVNGDLKPSTSVPTAIQKGAVFYITATQNGRILLKMQSMGNYTGQGFAPAEDTETLLGYSTAYLTGNYLDSLGYVEQPLFVEVRRDAYAVPYYVSPSQNHESGITIGDTTITGDGSTAYTVYYYPETVGYEPPSTITSRDVERYNDMLGFYTYVDQDTATYVLETLLADETWLGLADSDRIPAVVTFLQNRYVLNPDHDPALHEESDVVMAFLNDYKEGSARHFAAAATLIYRSLGIPARYTVGYVGEGKADAQAVVRGIDAYAWVEVFVQGIGWVTVDVAADAKEPSPEPEQKIILELKPTTMKVLYTGGLVTHNGLLSGFEKFEKLGYTYTAQTQGQRTECGHTTVTITSVTLYDPNGNDVTSKFDIVKKTGDLFVCVGVLRFASTNAEKVYDGTPLQIETAFLVDGYLPEGYVLEIIPSGGQTHVGVGHAAFSVRVWYQQGGTEENRTDYFIIEKQYGSLTVTPASLTVKAADAEKVYDGTPLTSGQIAIMAGGLMPGDTIDSYVVEGSRTNVGRSENVITSLVIRNSAGEDVTRNYSIETVAGTLKVTAP